MKETRPTKNEILRRNLPLYVCKDSQAICVYGINCWYAIPFFKRANDPENLDYCKGRRALVRIQPKPVLVVPLFKE